MARRIASSSLCASLQGLRRSPCHRPPWRAEVDRFCRRFEKHRRTYFLGLVRRIGAAPDREFSAGGVTLKEATMKRDHEDDYPIAKKFARVRLLTQAIFLSSGLATGMFVAHAANAAKALAAETSTPASNATSSGSTNSSSHVVTSDGSSTSATSARSSSANKTNTTGAGAGSKTRGGGSARPPSTTTRATSSTPSPTTTRPPNVTTTTRAPSSPVTTVVPTTVYVPPTTVPITTTTVCRSTPSGKVVCF